jgi:hypothetical protein
VLAWFKALAPFMKRFRLSRARRIKTYFPDIDNRSIVDIGGSLYFWKFVQSEIRPKQVTIYNIALDSQFDAANFGKPESNIQASVYDGRRIPANDKQVDLLICNSVIEHVPVDERSQLAREITRVARNYVVQTPAKLFPIEPHFVMPFLHWLPRRVGRILVRFSPFGLAHRDAGFTRKFFDEINILTADEFRSLFPEGEFVIERFLFIPKSYMIINRAS